mmetsp:Transcript_11403/g.24576  ORF Transcript_11403/g.24576 Transcript_11403/m.24576 type:complete len:449 (-) Transcript_11403:1244-2590(-)
MRRRVRRVVLFLVSVLEWRVRSEHGIGMHRFFVAAAAAAVIAAAAATARWMFQCLWTRTMERLWNRIWIILAMTMMMMMVMQGVFLQGGQSIRRTDRVPNAQIARRPRRILRTFPRPSPSLPHAHHVAPIVRLEGVLPRHRIPLPQSFRGPLFGRGELPPSPAAPTRRARLVRLRGSIRLLSLRLVLPPALPRQQLPPNLPPPPQMPRRTILHRPHRGGQRPLSPGGHVISVFEGRGLAVKVEGAFEVEPVASPGSGGASAHRGGGGGARKVGRGVGGIATSSPRAEGGRGGRGGGRREGRTSRRVRRGGRASVVVSWFRATFLRDELAAPRSLEGRVGIPRRRNALPLGGGREWGAFVFARAVSRVRCHVVVLVVGVVVVVVVVVVVMVVAKVDAIRGVIAASGASSVANTTVALDENERRRRRRRRKGEAIPRRPRWRKRFEGKRG